MAFTGRVRANQQALASALQHTYDFIVCGSGSSGSVVARRLAENHAVSVLLLEAGGPDDVPEVMQAAAWPANLGSERDWGFLGQPNRRLNDRALPLPLSMGRVLGGGSSINVMQWARGHESDWDFFAAEAGDDRWNYQSALQTYMRIEDWQGAPDAAHRGQGGLVYVQPVPQPHAVAHALLDSLPGFGIARHDSQDSALRAGGGCSLADVRIRDGKRLSAFRTYVYPCMDQPNLTVLPNALVARVRFEGKRAAGVECLIGGRMHSFNVAREVILSLGAVHTPKVLMQSGVGDAVELRAFGIPVVQHLPGVGRNFQDHCLIMGCVWEARDDSMQGDPGVQANAFWKTTSGEGAPDLQLLHNAMAFATPEVTARHGMPASGWTLLPSLVRPRSTGRLRLTGANPADPIEIDANSLADPADIKVLLAGIELARDIGNSAALRPFVQREVMPAGLRGAALREFVRDATCSVWHQTCTAKMGRDAMSVVDATLKVYGVDNLRIADGSIMPRVTTGNTMAPCIVIGERAGEFLVAEHRL